MSAFIPTCRSHQQAPLPIDGNHASGYLEGETTGVIHDALADETYLRATARDQPRSRLPFTVLLFATLLQDRMKELQGQAD